MTDQTEEVLIADVTAELVGERREDYRAGFDAGLRVGAMRVLESETLATVAAEVKMLRTLIEAMTEVAHQREKVIDWYRAKYVDLVRHIRARANERMGVDA